LGRAKRLHPVLGREAGQGKKLEKMLRLPMRTGCNGAHDAGPMMQRKCSGVVGVVTVPQNMARELEARETSKRQSMTKREHNSSLAPVQPFYHLAKPVKNPSQLCASYCLIRSEGQ
jgi:hypothetical protein